MEPSDARVRQASNGQALALLGPVDVMGRSCAGSPERQGRLAGTPSGCVHGAALQERRTCSVQALAVSEFSGAQLALLTVTGGWGLACADLTGPEVSPTELDCTASPTAPSLACLAQPSQPPPGPLESKLARPVHLQRKSRVRPECQAGPGKSARVPIQAETSPVQSTQVRPPELRSERPWPRQILRLPRSFCLILKQGLV